jgi:iron complex outermembrane receptor protein
MDYDNQLVLTGELNDVGSPIRTNVESSYRQGAEFEFGWNILKSLQLYANFTYSQNKIDSYTDILYNYLSSGDVEVRLSEIQNTDISFSPEIISSAMISWKPIRSAKHELEFSWMTQYVGEQYLDNTSNPDRVIDAYLVNDARMSYTLSKQDNYRARLNFWVNNVLSEEYSSNGYTYSYGFDDFITTENFFYPQAPRNFMVGLELSF